MEASSERVITTMQRVHLLICWVVCVAIVAWSVLPGFARSGSSTPFVTIAAGTTSRIREPEQLAIRDQNAWQKLWRRHSGSAASPIVNFNTDMVIAMFAGELSEPATLAIMRIARESDRLVVLYRVGPTRPPLDGSGIPPVAPFHIVRVARSALPVTFIRIKVPPVLAPQP
ncbi:MAG: hypothetical protein AUI83_10305 [Armatimonadetes bacterium 13_1_40CM_3_65_7]|nr:MAG: hypothetical protein AUI83_10305 [Armatimonadetes bacterium 13_1_40CM_3_65_7]